MRKEYNFSDSIKNPYAKHLNKQDTLHLNTKDSKYFQALATKTGIPYQNLIDLYTAWDARIEADATAGKLDAFAREALKEYKAGKAREI